MATNVSTKEKSRRFLPTRRGFLIAAGATVGVAVGFMLWPRQWPNAWQARDGETLMNAWVKIGPDGGVTVAVPQAEMGQGVFSGFAQIVAEELGADWQRVAVVPAPWHPAYANSGLVTEQTATLPPMVRDLAAYAGTEMVRRMNLHLTGGSSSIKGFHDRLVAAAAEARARLVMAAASEWGVAADAVEARGGMLVYKANRMDFGQAARLVDPDVEPPEALLERRPKKAEGRVLPRLDLPPKVDGSARFGTDVRLPDMLFAAIRHGPVNGRLAAATAAKNVKMVKGPNWVAAVGPTSWAAQQALDRITARFAVEGRPAGPWIEEELAKAVTGDGGEQVAGHGDVETGLGKGPLQADYRLPFLAHAAMEPMVATAHVDSERAEVWGPTQSLTLAHRAVAEALGLETSAVTIYPTLLGGSFGRKAEADCMVEAALIARAAGRPVQLCWSRQDDIGSDRFRPPAAARLRGQVTDGQLSALDIRIAVPSVSNSFMRRNMPALASDNDSPNAAAIEGATNIPYAAAAFRAVHIPVEQPVPLGFWRSVGHSLTAFVIESFIDELAQSAGTDPLAFRLSLLGDKPRHAAVLRAAAEAGQWGEPPAKGMARGLALHESFGSIVAMVVEAGVLGGDIRIGHVGTAIDCGRAINPDMIRAQVEGGAIMGLSAALGEAVTFEAGAASQSNFHDYPLMRMAQSPWSMTTSIITSGGPFGGVGEPGVPPAAPALANALARATGRRIRQLPLAGAYV